MNRALMVVLLIIAFDSGGVGLMMPVMPALLRDYSIVENVALYLGAFIALFAAMQFVFGPIMGVLSDRYGRRPILIISLLIAALDYLIMAFSPWIWLLYAARIVSGTMAASITVCMAYIGDVSDDDTRVRNFGYGQAAFGLGFLFGPAAGGLLGSYWVRLPFMGAAALAIIAAILAILVLKETRDTNTSEAERAPLLNPFAPLVHIFSLKGLWPLLAIFFVSRLVNQSYGVALIIFNEYRFGWTSLIIGLSISLFGLSQMLILSFVPGPLSRRFGPVKVAMIGLGVEAAALFTISFLTNPTVAFFMGPFFALGSIAVPALQSIASRAAGQSAQGEVQGVLTSLTGLTAIIGPLGFAALYSTTQLHWDGTVWAVCAGLYLLVIPLFLLLPGGHSFKHEIPS